MSFCELNSYIWCRDNTDYRQQDWFNYVIFLYCSQRKEENTETDSFLIFTLVWWWTRSPSCVTQSWLLIYLVMKLMILVQVMLFSWTHTLSLSVSHTHARSPLWFNIDVMAFLLYKMYFLSLLYVFSHWVYRDTGSVILTNHVHVVVPASLDRFVSS